MRSRVAGGVAGQGAAAAATASAGEEGGGPPPAKRAKTNWRTAMAAKLVRGGGGGGGGAGGGGVAGALVITEGIVDQLLVEEAAKYAVLWTPEHLAVHGFALPDEDSQKKVLCPLADFWALKRESMPVMSFLAHITLSLPPSSADVERLFSTAGFVFSERRQCLKPERFDNMMIVQGNWQDKYLKFTDEEKEKKLAARLAHNAAVSKGKKAAHAAKKKAASAGKKKGKGKSKQVQMDLHGNPI